MDGLINMYKPPGISSAKLLYRIRAITHQRRSGHAGTLDPAATGVLLLCFGRGTKLVEQLMDLPKVYRASARLDVVSESHDADRPLEPVRIAKVPTREELEICLTSLEGVIEQVPPQISAVKVGGLPAYKRMLRGQEVDLSPRPVRIDWIVVRRFAWPELEFDMGCGRGTYVRSLIRDVGARLGTGGCLTALSRLRLGPFTIESAWNEDDIRESRESHDYLLSLDHVADLIASGKGSVIPRPRVGIG